MTGRRPAGSLRLFVATRSDGRHLALVQDRGLLEYRIDRPDRTSRIGDIHLGRVLRIDQANAAGFVELGLDRPAFLPLAECGRKPVEGDAVVVQITRDAREGKGPRVTGRPVLPGLYLVLDPSRAEVGMSSRIADRDAAERLRAAVRPLCGEGLGFIVRHAALAAAPSDLAEEAQRLRSAWRDLEARAKGLRPPALLHQDADPLVGLLRDAGAGIAEIVVDSRAGAEILRERLAADLPPLADRVGFAAPRAWIPAPDEIAEQLEAALEDEVALPGGGFLIFEPGRTLTAVDVNSGALPEGRLRQRTERRQLDVNLEAAAEIARQLRLRNLGGIIVIDFIDVKSARARARVTEALAAALADDPAPCQIGAMSRFGLVEMTRRRRGPSLSEQLTATCPTCDGRGRVRKSAAPPPGEQP